MTREELLASLNTIGTCTDDVERRTLITNISGEIGSIYDANETLTASNNQYKTDNEALRSANMQLFLKVGGGLKSSQMDGVGSDPKPEPLKYEDLFNEKGGLK